MSGRLAMAREAPERIGPGALVMVVGPSGAGKDTLLARARNMLAGDDGIAFPRRCVTRAPSAFENNEQVSGADFESVAASGGYALWWRAHGHGYGIPRAIDEDIALGRVVVVNVSRAIIGEAARRYEKGVVALITAPPDVLAGRLAARRRSSDRDLGDRLRRASFGLRRPADITICNVGAVEERAHELAGFLSDVLRDIRSRRKPAF